MVHHLRVMSNPPNALPWRDRLVTPVAVFIGYWILRILGATWRVRYLKDDWRDCHILGEKTIAAFWHNRVLGVVYLYRGFGITTLISASKDGGVIAGIAERLGHRAIRGSSSRGAVAGLKGLVQAARTGD